MTSARQTAEGESSAYSFGAPSGGARSEGFLRLQPRALLATKSMVSIAPHPISISISAPPTSITGCSRPRLFSSSLISFRREDSKAKLEMAGEWRVPASIGRGDGLSTFRSRPPHVGISTSRETFDPQLRLVLELASDCELLELEGILFGPSYLSPLLKSVISRQNADYDMDLDDIEERDIFISNLESRFFYLAADAHSVIWRRGHSLDAYESFHNSCYRQNLYLVGGQLAAVNLESRAGLLAARQGLAHAASRYLGLRSLMMFLGPLMWGTFLADVVIQMLGTDYAWILRAIYAFALIRLTQTNAWTS